MLAPPTPSNAPTPAGVSLLGGNLVVIAGISLCLAVILATVLVTVWRKLCRAPPCSSVRRASMHSPGGRKLSDEASICGHSLQRPSLSESQGQGALGLGVAQAGSSPLGCQALPQSLVLPPAQDPDRLSPSGQKVLPPIFGYVTYSTCLQFCKHVTVIIINVIFYFKLIYNSCIHFFSYYLAKVWHF